MTGLKQKLDRFTDTVLSEAAVEHDAILREIEQARRKALADAEEMALHDADQYIRGELNRIRSELGREVSHRMQEHKRRLAQRREEIAGQVFEQVRRRLEEYASSPEYVRRLAGLFREALVPMNGGRGLILSLRPRDMTHAAALRAQAKGRAMEVRSGSFLLGGLILECPSLGLRADQTFDSRLDGLRGHWNELAGAAVFPREEDGGHG